MTHHELLRAALRLAEAGLRPVPTRADLRCPMQRGWMTATCLPQDVRRRFAEARRADSLGVVTGHGMFVVDLDRNHDDGGDGVAAFAALSSNFNVVPVGPAAATPRGGLHLYFASPSGVRVASRTGVLPGVDVRGEGGMAMAAPSRRGMLAYRWVRDPWTWSIPMAPDSLLDLVVRREARQRPVVSVRAYHGTTHPYARKAFESEVLAVAGASKGQRNATLFRASASLGSLAAGGALSAEAVANALMDAAIVCGLIADDGRAAAEATIASGLRHGLHSPRAVPEGRQ